MTPREELQQFMVDHRDDPRVLAGLLDIATRMIAGESVESIAASYGIEWEEAQE